MSTLSRQTWRKHKSVSILGALRRNRFSARTLEQCEDRVLMAIVPLGAAQTFTVLGATTVTSTGLSTIVGDVGVSPGTAVTGFPPGVVTGGTIHSNDAVAMQAHSDLAIAYGVLAGEVPTTDLSGQDLGGLTLAPGVYHFATSAMLSAGTKILTLDAQGNPDARFDFQIGTTLTTASLSSIRLINGAQDNNVFFQVGSSATLGTFTAFEGSILANTSITLTTGASLVHGRALALNAAVTLDTNNVSVPVNPVPVLTSINPASVPEGTTPLTLTANGSNFVPTSVVQFNGVPLATTYVSSTQLQAIVPAADRGEEGVAAITVTSPPPGGGTSIPAQFTITDPAVVATGGFILNPAFGGATGNQTVATFTDPAGAEPNRIDLNPPTLNGHYAATVDWGDGTPSTPGTITFNAATGVFTVSGNHTYTARSGTFPITVTVNHENASPVTVTSTAVVGDALLAASPVPVFGTEGAPLTNVDVATFTDPDPSSSAGDFVTTINWGDGTSTAGTVVKDASGTYHVQGSHTYTEENATPIPIAVLIVDIGGGRAANDPTNSKATVTSPATIRQSPLLPVASAVVATEGAAIAAGTPLASFTDTGGADPVGDYTATINWGDGTATTAATVSLLGNGGNFAVTSATPHTYAEEGIYAITATITDNDPTNPNGVPTSAMTTGTATVNDAALTAVSSPAIPAAVEGKAFTAQVASFTDANTTAPVTDFTATIEWGDGSPQSAGTIVTDPAFLAGTGHFLVLGNHTYADENAAAFTISVAITDAFDGKTSATTTANVADATLVNPVGLPQFGNENQVLSNIPLGTFADNNALATAADFTATIDWGDASPTSPGFVTLVGGNGTQAFFSASGSHLYSTPGVKTVVIRIVDDGGQFTTINTTVTVTASPMSTTPVGGIAGVEGIATAGGVIATFTDVPGDDPASNYLVTINYGDSTPPDTTAFVVNSGGGNYSIHAASHVFPEEGIYPVTISIQDIDSPGSPIVGATLATVADAPLTGINGGTINGTEGTAIGPQPIATFTDANPLGTVSDFTATIDWGDGSPQSPGQITQTGATAMSSGLFTVSGNHTYANPSTGAGYPVTIYVKDQGGKSVILTNFVTVNASTITVTPLTFNAVEGQPVTNVVVATFTDSGIPGPISSYSASISWGDGVSSTVTPGQIVPLGGNQIEVLGSLPTGYPEEGNFNVLVSVSHNGVLVAGSPYTSTARVADASLQGATVPIVATEGTPFTGAVANFSDADPNGTATDYTVTINWGDGTASVTFAGSAANILQPSGPGTPFTVNVGVPGHLYTEEGPFTLTVTLTDHTSTFTATGEVHVNDIAPVAANPQPVVTINEGAYFSGPVARFQEIYGTFAEPITDFTATIDWGDGSPNQVGTIVPTGTPGVYQVVGSHVYANLGNNIGGTPGNPTGTFTIAVVVHDDGGSNLTITNPATLTEVPIVVTGQLNPSSDTGKFHNDGVTNHNQPNFFGTTEPFAHVRLFANGTLVGRTEALSDGSWNITSNRLADGTYAITATGQDQAGLPIAPRAFPISVVTNGGPNVLTIDTVGPRVVNAFFDRFTGTVSLTFSDFGGTGLLQEGLVDSANYAFNNQHARPLGKYIIGAINVTSGTGTGDQTVDLSIVSTYRGTPLTRRVLRGFFQIIAHSASVLNTSGIQDLAGNGLDGEFYGPGSASGNGIPGGDFVANFNNFHNIINPPATVIGIPHPNDPPAHFAIKPAKTHVHKTATKVKVATVTTGSSTIGVRSSSNSHAAYDLALQSVVVPQKKK